MAHLVFQTAFPGDLFLSIPLIKRLRAYDPENHIVLACRPDLGAFFKDAGLVDEVIEVDKRSGEGRAAAMAKIFEREWDLVLVPHESVRTALWMLRVRARQGRIGFAKWWNRFFFFHKRVVKPKHLPDALRQMALMAAVDPRVAEYMAEPEVQELASPFDQNEISLAKPAIPEWASMRVLSEKPASAQTVFLAPGSVWGTKRWTASGYEELARLLLKRGMNVELVGSKAEQELCAAIAAKVPGVKNRCGETTLGGLVELLSTGKALVCNDSGAMHAAAAAGVPTVAIFGPTTLNLGFRPWNNRAVVVQRELNCRPCSAHGPQVCPIGTHACMEGIPAAQVLAALDKLLN